MDSEVWMLVCIWMLDSESCSATGSVSGTSFAWSDLRRRAGLGRQVGLEDRLWLVTGTGGGACCDVRHGVGLSEQVALEVSMRRALEQEEELALT